MASDEFFAAPRRGRWVAIVAGVVVVVAAAVFAVWQLGGSSPDEPDAADPSSPAGTAPATPTALTVISGSSQEDGVSVGYPHSLIGAVSASVEYMSQLASTLDETRAADIGEVVADPLWDNAADEFAHGVASLREQVGVPADGAVPDGVSVTVAPVAYQLRNQTPDKMTVLLLAYTTTQRPDREPQSGIGVYPLMVRWVDADWRWVRPDGTIAALDIEGLRQTPGSPEADALGWLPLTR